MKKIENESLKAYDRYQKSLEHPQNNAVHLTIDSSRSNVDASDPLPF